MGQNVVWDLEKGTVLKLGENLRIVFAVSGKKVLTQNEIIEGYGNPPRFTNLKYPQTNKYTE